MAYFVSEQAAEKFVEMIDRLVDSKIAKVVRALKRQQANQIKHERFKIGKLRDKLAEQAELCERVEGLERENLWLKCDAHGLKGALDLAKKMLLGDE
jgi:hypothetical protein